ncbi:MAG: hypothetical protein NTZ67_02520 [Gammaproteobacteria bacterium]|nr:hypothetical protein [Gammaproteobacteria bacterium]
MRSESEKILGGVARLAQIERENNYILGKEHFEKGDYKAALEFFFLAEASELHAKTWKIIQTNVGSQLDKIEACEKDNLAAVSSAVDAILKITNELKHFRKEALPADRDSLVFTANKKLIRLPCILEEFLTVHSRLTYKAKKPQLDSECDQLFSDTYEQADSKKIKFLAQAKKLHAQYVEINELFPEIKDSLRYEQLNKLIIDLESYHGKEIDLKMFEKITADLTNSNLYDNIFIDTGYYYYIDFDAILKTEEQCKTLFDLALKLKNEGVNTEQTALLIEKTKADIARISKIYVFLKNIPSKTAINCIKAKSMDPNDYGKIKKFILLMIMANPIILRRYLSASNNEILCLQDNITSWLTSMLERQYSCCCFSQSEVAASNSKELSLDKSLFLQWFDDQSYTPILK